RAEARSPSLLFRSPPDLLIGARTGEYAVHAIVPLVACILVDMVGRFRHRDGRGPGTAPGLRIGDRELVDERRRVEPLQPLDQMELLGGAAAKTAPCEFRIQLQRP